MNINSISSIIYPVISNAVKVEEKNKVDENISVEYSFTDIIIHNDNNTSNNSSNNDNNSNIKGILKKSEPNNEVNIMFILKGFMIILILAFTVPFIICNLYYAYNDNSCVTINPDNFGVNLKTYLAVDGIVVGIALLGIILAAFCLFKEPDNNDNCSLNVFGKIATIFGIAWTIVGAVIFWKLIDNTKCDKSVYNYIFVQLVIKIVCYLLRIISNSNNKK